MARGTSAFGRFDCCDSWAASLYALPRRVQPCRNRHQPTCALRSSAGRDGSINNASTGAPEHPDHRRLRKSSGRREGSMRYVPPAWIGRGAEHNFGGRPEPYKWHYIHADKSVVAQTRQTWVRRHDACFRCFQPQELCDRATSHRCKYADLVVHGVFIAFER